MPKLKVPNKLTCQFQVIKQKDKPQLPGKFQQFPQAVQ
jgi:hypothetical protein